MGNQFPKNVRQIGNVSDVPRIYMEDYVDTFINQLCERAKDKPSGAVLVGETVNQDGNESVFISGAVQMEEIDQNNIHISVSDQVWKTAEQEAGAYFPEKQVVGWFLVSPGQPLKPEGDLTRIHEQHFTGQGSLLVVRDIQEKEEQFFVYKLKQLLPLGGYYIYYEKNPEMQNYMIACRKKNGVTSGEVVEDQAAKNFRNIVKEKVEGKEQQKTGRYQYAMSVFLVLFVLAMGVTLLSNYDKMQAVQTSLDSLRDSFASGETTEVPAETTEESVKQEETVETSGTIVSQTGDEPEEMPEQSEEEEDQEVVSTMQEMSDDIYIVEKGDTLAKISKKVYGDISHVDAICRMNGLSDGNLIFIGQKLLLP